MCLPVELVLLLLAELPRLGQRGLELGDLSRLWGNTPESISGPTPLLQAAHTTITGTESISGQRMRWARDGTEAAGVGVMPAISLGAPRTGHDKNGKRLRCSQARADRTTVSGHCPVTVQ